VLTREAFEEFIRELRDDTSIRRWPCFVGSVQFHERVQEMWPERCPKCGNRWEDHEGNPILRFGEEREVAMPGVKREDLDEIFTYHPPTEEQVVQYGSIRRAARAFALAILESTPPSPDQTVAIRKVREAVMVANASIALNGKF
jgi:hypothetical protein